jgi:protein-tyrosine-phosphatase
VLSLALAYFAAYIPYALLTKALTSGILPDIDRPVGGLVVLPAAAIGQLLAMPVFLFASGWWRFARERRLQHRSFVLPGRDTALAGLFMALVIGTTTLNFTFVGVSILLMLLLMRAGVLILSPVVDLARGDKVARYTWIALTLSLVAVVVALGDVRSYQLTPLAIGSLCLYFAGYVGRFQIMSKVAKTGVREVDLRYFVEEHAMAPIFLVALCAAGAVLGQPDLREGFTSFFRGPGAPYAIVIGVLYELLFIFGSLIYLDVRGYAWCVPVNRIATLCSGIVGSYILVAMAGLPPPGASQLLALVIVTGAVLALAHPALRDWRRGTAPPRERMVLFVCGGNLARSAIAECLARGLVAATRSGQLMTITSAGIQVATPGTPMTAGAYAALRQSGAIPHRHRSRPLTAELCRRADVIYCMTAAQREAVIALAPDVAARTHSLAAHDIPEPPGASLQAYRDTTAIIERAVRQRLREVSWT